MKARDANYKKYGKDFYRNIGKKVDWLRVLKVDLHLTLHSQKLLAQKVEGFRKEVQQNIKK